MSGAAKIKSYFRILKNHSISFLKKRPLISIFPLAIFTLVAYLTVSNIFSTYNTPMNLSSKNLGESFVLSQNVSEGDIGEQKVLLSASKRNNKKDRNFTPTPTLAPSPSVSNSPTPTATPTATQSGLTPTVAVSSPTITEQRLSANFGVVVNDYANRTGELSSLEQMTGRSFSSVSIFKQFGSRYNSNLILDDLAYIKSNNKRLLIAWEPWNPEQGGNQSIDYLKEIPEGKHDIYLKSFATTIRSYGAPVTLRFGHEMNGNWYPWGQRPAEYIKAYRYVVTFLKNEGVSNVNWMWSINAENVPTSPISSVNNFYPGNDVVDVVGIDGFNFGTSSGGWRSFRQIFSPAYEFLSANYDKPIVISETASAEIGGNKPAWVTAMANDLPIYFSKVSEVIWFSILKEADWRINSSEATLQSFKEILN